MARTSMIDTDEDMKWLRDVHLPKLPATYKSAIIHGNEDYPDRIEVYAKRAPLVTDEPLVFEPDTDGVYRQVAKSARHHSTRKPAAQLEREIADVLAKDYRVRVRVEGAPKPVHVSSWMTQAQAEHAAKNHKAMIRDRGWAHVVEIEDKSGAVTRFPR